MRKNYLLKMHVSANSLIPVFRETFFSGTEIAVYYSPRLVTLKLSWLAMIRSLTCWKSLEIL